MELGELSDRDLIAALREKRLKREYHYTKWNREERLAWWGEVIPLREELHRRHPIVLPPEIIKRKLWRSEYFLYLATCGGRKRTSRDHLRLVAQSVLDMARAVTPQQMEAADCRLDSGARRIWYSLLPEYDGRFDPPGWRRPVLTTASPQS
jgi:hypothetical protein